MQILRIEVDELPKTCEHCIFSDCDYSYNIGSCVALGGETISLITGCTHRDCPLVVVEDRGSND